jgi:predicted N-acetyltransferase YhbS
MGATPGTAPPETDLLIRPMRDDDLPAADRVRRLAFGTFLGLPDPLSFRGDADPLRTRYLADPSAAFAAEFGGELVGTNVAVDWGSVGFFGPLSVRPDLANRGVAQRLVAAVMEVFERRGTPHVGLFTFGHSPKHLALYQKFGFWPRFPTAIMARPVEPSRTLAGWSAFSELTAGEQQACLEGCYALTDAVYPGLDLSLEIRATERHRLGETVLLLDGSDLIGFAVCHCGPGTEAGGDACYVKFGAVRPGPEAEPTLTRLLDACKELARARGLTRLVAGVNTARRAAYRSLLAYGFRTDILGLAMHRPDEAGYNRPDVYLLDDWR